MDSLSGVSVPELSDYKDTLSAVDSILFVTVYDPGLTSGQNTEICFHPGKCAGDVSKSLNIIRESGSYFISEFPNLGEVYNNAKYTLLSIRY